MKTLTSRIARLEDQFGSADGKPRWRLRIVVTMAGAKPCVEDAMCNRTLWPNGTLFELVWFNKHNERPDELTDEELEQWIEGFPVN